MSNKRIDLTQFEGMVEGPWRTVGSYKRWGIVREDYARGYICNFGNIERRDPTVKALVATPDLIAELERCYDKIDDMWDYIEHLDGHDMQSLADDSYHLETIRLRQKASE